MPGELGNCIAGRIANLFNLHGPNFTTDAACASALAAMDATVDGLLAHEFDVAITGGIDRNMGVHTFVKFCAIGALSPSGTRPYSEGADGFVMGEGAALFVVKRLADAVRDGDRIYAVVRGVGSASDGKGKGITAPNPVGQRFAVERAWRNAGLSPAECTLDRGPRHLDERGRRGRAEEPDGGLLRSAACRRGSIALGSVKSNIGHLKGGRGSRGHAQGHARAARQGAAAEPQLRATQPQPGLDRVAVRRQHRAARLGDRRRAARASPASARSASAAPTSTSSWRSTCPDRHATNGHGLVGRRSRSSSRPRRRACARRRVRASRPLRGALVLGAADEAGLANALRTELAEARQGRHLDPTPPRPKRFARPERIAIDYADGPDLVAKAELALRVLAGGQPVGVAGAARPRHPPRQRHPGQGGVPLHRPGLAVREHARRAAPAGARGRRPVRRGRRAHGAAARGPAPVRHRSSPTRRTRRRWRARRRSFAAPRSSSRR